MKKSSNDLGKGGISIGGSAKDREAVEIAAML